MSEELRACPFVIGKPACKLSQQLSTVQKELEEREGLMEWWGAISASFWIIKIGTQYDVFHRPNPNRARKYVSTETSYLDSVRAAKAHSEEGE